MKGKPIPEGLKLYVLTESETGFILNAFVHHSKLTTDKQDYGVNFGIVVELLEGLRLGDNYSLLDQGFTVSSFFHWSQIISKPVEVNICSFRSLWTIFTPGLNLLGHCKGVVRICLAHCECRGKTFLLICFRLAEGAK